MYMYSNSKQSFKDKALERIMCDVKKNTTKMEVCNEKWERKPAAKY